MQTIWSGAISFGLVSIPVRLYSAVEEKSLKFNMLHAEDNGRVKFNRTCAECGKEGLTPDDMVKAYEYEKGSWVTFDDSDFSQIEVPSTRRIDLAAFVPSEQIDPKYFHKSYILGPSEIGSKQYALLMKALTESGRVGVAKIAIREKERLAAIRATDEGLILETMFWPDEVRTPEFELPGADAEPNSKELDMAKMLIETMSDDFHPEEFTDDYRAALLEMVESKVEGREVVRRAETEESEAQVVDIMAALEQSITKAREQRASATG